MAKQPTKRKMLPDVRPELFEVATANFVITEDRIIDEKILGAKFVEEIESARKMFGSNRRVNMDGLSLLLADVENADDVTSPAL